MGSYLFLSTKPFSFIDTLVILFQLLMKTFKVEFISSKEYFVAMEESRDNHPLGTG